MNRPAELAAFCACAVTALALLCWLLTNEMPVPLALLTAASWGLVGAMS